MSGDHGKPRPALVIQSDAFEGIQSVTVLPLSGELRDRPLFQITVQPTKAHGLKRVSQVMVDKALPVPRGKVGQRFGRIEANVMRDVDTAVASFLGLA